MVDRDLAAEMAPLFAASSYTEALKEHEAAYAQYLQDKAAWDADTLRG